MARGGARRGTPGKSYVNRSDLNTARQTSVGTNTPAAGGVQAPNAPAAPPTGLPANFVAPDAVPKLDDPTARPNEPVTAGLETGPGPGPEALGPLGPTAGVQRLQAAYMAFPTPELGRTLALMRRRGAL